MKEDPMTTTTRSEAVDAAAGAVPGFITVKPLAVQKIDEPDSVAGSVLAAAGVGTQIGGLEVSASGYAHDYGPDGIKTTSHAKAWVRDANRALAFHSPDTIIVDISRGGADGDTATVAVSMPLHVASRLRDELNDALGDAFLHRQGE